MAEVITKASDLKKIFAKLGIEEEPIIVLQRYLNIFKQLHIFDEKKKEDFNKTILGLPPEARGLFKTLPGGSLLQEYVNDLEQQAGQVRDKSNESNAGFDYGNKSAPAPVAAAVAGVSAAPVVASGELKVVADESFAKQMAAALASAVGATGKQGNQTMVGDIIKAQSELFSNMARTQTKEISSIISIALKESHELSTKSIIDAIKIFQKENLEALGNREDKKKDKDKRFEGYRKIASHDDEWEYIEVDANNYKGLDHSLFDESAIDLESLETPIDAPKTTSENDKEGIPLKIKPDEINDLNATSIEPAKAKLEKIKEDMAAAFEGRPDVALENKANDDEILDLDDFLAGDEDSVDIILAKEENISPALADASKKSAVKENDRNDEEEWEWQEVEDDEAVSLSEEDSEFVNYVETEDGMNHFRDDLASTEAEENDDWEWEYEEIPEEEKPESNVANLATGDDWEWEYEEVPEETEETVSATPADDDWEWEYEEVPEEGETDKSEVSLQDDSQWEWDYEEEDDDEDADDNTPPLSDAAPSTTENNVSGTV